MKEVLAPSKSSGTADVLELDLAFELIPRPEPVEEDLHEALLAEIRRSSQKATSSERASLLDCQMLLVAVSSLLQPALDHAVEGALVSRRGRSLNIPIQSIHYGSPFEFQFLLPMLTPAGLAALLYMAKRLYGIDLEFKAHREKRRLEYLEAKAMAEEFQDPPPPLEGAIRPAENWRLRKGTIKDPSQ
jgi:hypothetical protein